MGRSKAVEVPQSKFDNPRIPAAILLVGDLLWKSITWLRNFDFIFSMREERLAAIFEGLLKWGWVVILVYALARLAVPGKPSKKTTQREMLIYVGVLAFISGTLLGTWAAGSEPQIAVDWGGNTEGCGATLDTSRLIGYADKYKVATACKLADPAVDDYSDQRIAFSDSFTITGDRQNIVIWYKGTKMEEPARTSEREMKTRHFTLLFPKDEDVHVLKSLSQIKTYQGILLGR
jgi:hypothetical protein